LRRHVTPGPRDRQRAAFARAFRIRQAVRRCTSTRRMRTGTEPGMRSRCRFRTV